MRMCFGPVLCNGFGYVRSHCLRRGLRNRRLDRGREISYDRDFNLTILRRVDCGSLAHLSLESFNGF